MRFAKRAPSRPTKRPTSQRRYSTLFHVGLARFGKAHGEMTLHITLEHARGLGFALTVNVAVLELIRARVARGAIEFSELRDWFAEHLVTIPRKPWPPR